MKKKYLVVGKIVNTHGVRGQVKVVPLTDDPQRFKKLKSIFLDIKGKIKPLTITSSIIQNKFIILKFDNIDDMDEARKLKNYYININRDDAIELPEDSYFISDLIGLNVITIEGKQLGIIDDILTPGGNDVYVIKNGDKEILLPAIKDVIKNIDFNNKLITVKLLEGLEDIYDF